MELEFTQGEEEEENKPIIFYGDEVYLARSCKDDDRLLFVRDGKLIMAMNTNTWRLQVGGSLDLYGNLKRVSRLELKAILEA